MVTFGQLLVQEGLHTYIQGTRSTARGRFRKSRKGPFSFHPICRPLKTASEIRAEFLAFFEEKQHTVVPSDSLVPGNDPTLLFTNAGMNQFKDVFLGEGDRSYVRAADTQKCLRVSGKHNDLDEVGYDTYHHTFFEMLGNWSFGDYFKKEAVTWAWELLVDRWKLNPSRLYITVHEGDEALGLAADNEAADYWKSETGVSPDHILFCSSKDNFWMMGDTGPCGPCSEIHIDLRSDEERAAIPGASLVNKDDPRVMEIWNLVFIQYNAQTDGSLKPLAAQHVDTGMGFERVVAVMQEQTSNYDTDLFIPILDDIARRAPLESIDSYASASKLEGAESDRVRIALRVMADHVRTIAFAVADGVMPGNAGRGYVIRRILRRAVRYGYQTLGFRDPVLFDVVDTVIGIMGEQFPELTTQRDYIKRVVKAEEDGFLETLGTGIQYFETIAPYVSRAASASSGDVRASLLKDRAVVDLLEKALVDVPERELMADRFMESASKGLFPGAFAFLLHDTYGFPVDLTQLMAREAGLGVDMQGYQAYMDQQKSRARAAGSFKVDQSGSDDWTVVRSGEKSVFEGYDALKVDDAQILSMRTVDDVHQLVLDSTPFYAESGGQVGDTGMLDVGGDVLQVLDTRKAGDRIVHIVDRLPADAMSTVRAQVDAGRRSRITKHHSVTHLLHAALRERLGSHVAQKGSLVSPEHLRFDFSHFERLTAEDLHAVELRVNESIQANIARGEERGVPIADALARGATALFGEKYGEAVRVITFDPSWSIELCGGTHVGATGEIGLFRFRSEGSVAAGIRRVEAVAGMDALAFLHAELEELSRARGQFKTLQRPLDEEVEAILERTRVLEKDLEGLQMAQMTSYATELAGTARLVGDVRLVTGLMPAPDMNALRSVTEDLRNQWGPGHVIVLAATDDEAGKVYIAASVSDDVIARGVQAGKLVGTLAKIVGGGGGGRPQLATAGGKDPARVQEVFSAAETELGTALGVFGGS